MNYDDDFDFFDEDYANGRKKNKKKVKTQEYWEDEYYETSQKKGRNRKKF